MKAGKTSKTFICPSIEVQTWIKHQPLDSLHKCVQNQNILFYLYGMSQSGSRQRWRKIKK